MKTNYHTHTIFCDGKATVQQMIEDAIKSGFDILGFSSHAAFPYQSSWHLKTQKYADYIETIRKLEAEYSDKIKIMAGFEADYLPAIVSPDKSRYEDFKVDFLIGSVHYVLNFDEPEAKGYPQEYCDIPVNCFAVDGSTEEVKEGLASMFGGDGKKMCQTYFAEERDMASSCDFDIIGHPDIIRKRNSVLHFFDESEDWYKREIEETAKVFAKSGKVVEVNYGGIARGTLNDTYPGTEFLCCLKKYDVPLTISADAHNVGQMNVGYDFAVQKMKDAGYSVFHYLLDGKWQEQSL